MAPRTEHSVRRDCGFRWGGRHRTGALYRYQFQLLRGRERHRAHGGRDDYGDRPDLRAPAPSHHRQGQPAMSLGTHAIDPAQLATIRRRYPRAFARTPRERATLALILIGLMAFVAFCLYRFDASAARIWNG